MENLLYLLGTGTEVCLAVGFLCTFCRGEWESGTAFQLYCIAAFAVMSAFGLVWGCRFLMRASDRCFYTVQGYFIKAIGKNTCFCRLPY